MPLASVGGREREYGTPLGKHARWWREGGREGGREGRCDRGRMAPAESCVDVHCVYVWVRREGQAWGGR